MARKHTGRAGSTASLLVTLGILGSFSVARGQVLDWQYGGIQAQEWTGRSVASGFDTNGDGVDDFLYGSPFYDRGLTDQGEVVVLSGATRGLLGVTLGGSAGDWYGFSATLVNDLDGDGVGEYCVGAPGWNTGDGYVTMISGKTSTALWTVYGASNAQLGFSVAPAGDVDGDGRVDVVVGAPGIDTAYVFGWNVGAIYTLTGQSGSRFGQAVAGGEDVNGDGTPDFVIGQPGYTSGFPLSVDRGAMRAYSGATGAQLVVVFGDNAGDQLGWTVCCLGDVNGDGRSEFVAGTPFDDDNGTDSGMVRVYDSTGTSDYELHGGGAGNAYGWSLARLADMTRDGVPDLAIGLVDAGSAGLVHLVQGKNGTHLFTIVPPDATFEAFGYSVASGDFNQDGVSDLVVSDPNRDVNGQANAGNVDLWLMSPAFWENYGTGWPGTQGVPALVALDDPGIGELLSIQVGSSASFTTPAILMIGVSQTSVPTTAGGTLLVLPTWQIPLPLAPGGLTLSTSLPSNPSLLMVDLYLQTLIVDPGASHGLAFSPGLRLALGYDYP